MFNPVQSLGPMVSKLVAAIHENLGVLTYSAWVDAIRRNHTLGISFDFWTTTASRGSMGRSSL